MAEDKDFQEELNGDLIWFKLENLLEKIETHLDNQVRILEEINSGIQEVKEEVRESGKDIAGASYLSV